MRPTNLGFKSPREVCQAPQYIPTVTVNGTKLINASSSTNKLKQRPKSNLSSRFSESHSSNNSVFVGPGKYKDEHKTIMHSVKSKIAAKYKGDMIDSRACPLTYAGDAKVLDLAFLSPQAKKAFPYVITTSITLTSPKVVKVNTPTSLGSFSNQSTAYSTVQQSKGENPSNKTQRHNRTKSFQVSEGIKAPWEKILHNLGHVPGDYDQKTSGDHARKGSIELTKAQKQRNDQIYSQLIDSQLSNDLKNLKKELESYQKKKTFRETQMYDTKQNWSTTDGTNTRKATETDKGEEDIHDEKENGKLYIQVQEDVQAQEPIQEQEQEQLIPEPRVLVEASSNRANMKGSELSFDGEGFITMNIASPKFGSTKQKEGSNVTEQKSMNKAIELKRRAMVTLTSNSSVQSTSYHSRSGSMSSKTVRKL